MSCTTIFFGATLWFAIRLHTLYNRVDVALVVVVAVLGALLHVDTVTLVQFTIVGVNTPTQTTLTRLDNQTHTHRYAHVEGVFATINYNSRAQITYTRARNENFSVQRNLILPKCNASNGPGGSSGASAYVLPR